MIPGGSSPVDWRMPRDHEHLQRVAVIALDVPPAVAAMAVRGISREVVVTVRASQASVLRSVRRKIRCGELDEVLEYSSDRARQSYPSLCQLALTATTRGRSWFLANGAAMTVTRHRGLSAAAASASLALGVLFAVAQVLLGRREITVPAQASSVPETRIEVQGPTSTRIIVVWRGSPSAVGGAITHLQGILTGFQTLGYRIALVSSRPLPPGIGRNVDKFILTAPLRAQHRFSRDTTGLALGRQMVDVCRELVALLNPTAIYQRHAYQCVAGVRVAGETGLPSILEWIAQKSGRNVTGRRLIPSNSFRRGSNASPRCGRVRS